MDDSPLKNFKNASEKTRDEKPEKSYAALKEEFETVHKQLSLIRDHISQGLLFVDQNGTVTLFNNSAEKILMINRGEAIGKKFDEVFKDKELGFSFKEAAQSQNAPSLRDLVYFTKENIPHEKILEVEPAVIAKENGSGIEGIIILIKNITHFRRMEQIADRKSRLQDLAELASTIGHEIRNPLGGIKGFASLLQKELQDDPKLSRMISNIIQGVDDLNKILTELSNYSHAQPINTNDLDVKALVQETISELQHSAGIKEKVDIIFKAPSHPVMAQADARHLKSALVNLVLNSTQAIENKGSITISLTETTTNIRIKIEDTGCGIEEKNLKKIFRPDFSAKQEERGCGLGEVRKIVDAHQGRIDAASEPGKGTTLILTIPRKHED